MANKKEVLESLRSQLEERGVSVAAFDDLVEDYGKLWDIKNKLIRDIKKRGVVYKDFSAVGVEIQKNNPSTKELMNVERHMLLILDKLDLSTKNCESDIDDEL